MDVLVFSTGTKILKTHIYTWKNLENVLRNASSKVEMHVTLRTRMNSWKNLNEPNNITASYLH